MDEEQRDDILQKFKDYKISLLTATANSILKSTIQFFKINSVGNPFAVGSGLLISHEDRFFVVTAAHVIAEDYDMLYVLQGNDAIKLGGRLHCSVLPTTGNRDDDKIDVAVLELCSISIARLITTYTFTKFDNIDIGHINSELSYYFSVGYPVSKTKEIRKKNRISSIPFPYQSSIDENFDYDKFGFNAITHIAIKFDGQIISGKIANIHTAPLLHGISGSGLWYLKDFGLYDMVENRQLVGVLIERTNKLGNKALVATRIDLVTELMRSHFGLSIPQSKFKIKINNI